PHQGKVSIMSLNRRDFLTGLAGAAGAAALLGPTGCATFSGGGAPAIHGSRRRFSFVHLTDMHVRRKRKGDLGYAVCIDDVKKNFGKAHFALMGGDLAFDGNYNEK